MAKDPLPAAMSFMLPGLGHLFSGNSTKALFFFGLFTLLNWSRSTRILVPIVVVVASWDTYRNTPTEKEATKADPRRKAAFLAVGFACFLAWMSMVAFVMLPYGNQVTINNTVEHIAGNIRACAGRLGRLPLSIDECGAQPKDPWGQAFSYEAYRESFRLRSLGRDGKPRTEDDFVYNYQFR